MISIIIPIYNEEEVLSQNADPLRKLSQSSEVIFVDGGSSDKSRELAQGLGKVLASQKGRALQMNQGAKQASHETLLFLHADCYVFPDTLKSILKQISQGLIGGCLTQRIESKGLIFRFIESTSGTILIDDFDNLPDEQKASIIQHIRTNYKKFKTCFLNL